MLEHGHREGLYSQRLPESYLGGWVQMHWGPMHWMQGNLKVVDSSLWHIQLVVLYVFLTLAGVLSC